MSVAKNECPACEDHLEEIMAGNVKVDVCSNGCGGVWFDALEVKKFDEPSELNASLIFDRTASATKKATKKTIRSCPKCSDTVLWRRYYDQFAEVEVDQCPECSGLWFDSGELADIRKQFDTEDQRNRAADKYLESRLKEAEAVVHQGTVEEIAKIERLRKDPLVQLREIIRAFMRV